MASRALRSFVALLVGVSVASCGGGGEEASGPDTTGIGAGGLTVSLSPGSVSIVQTASATTTVTIARNGKALPSVTLSTTIPTGLTATFNPPLLTGGAATSTLTISASATIDA